MASRRISDRLWTVLGASFGVVILFSISLTGHARAVSDRVWLAVASDGSFLGLRVTGFGDLGAHLEGFTCLPPVLCGRLVTGAYRIPAASYTVRGAFTICG